jgi:phosphoglucomutase
MTARTGSDPGAIYAELTHELGAPVFDRVEAPASAEQRARLGKLAPSEIRQTTLAGEPIRQILTTAPGNQESIGGVKMISENGWCAARPSGTESIYKIYAESFKGDDQLRLILKDAQTIVDDALGAH